MFNKWSYNLRTVTKRESVKSKLRLLFTTSEYSTQACHDSWATVAVYYNAPNSFASAVYATANLSVRPSVTRQYCQDGMQRMRTSPSGSPVSVVFWRQEWLMGDDRLGKIWVQRSTPCENSQAVHISPHNPGTAKGREESWITVKANRNSTTGFPKNEPSTKVVRHP